MPLSSRILTGGPELEAFARMFESHGGNAVAGEYLCRAKVRAFFRGNEPVAGYVLNSRAPFRYASWVPSQIGAELQQRGYLVEATCAELTCMWMSTELRPLERNRVYVQLVIDAFNTGKRFIFAGSCVAKVARIQKTTLPRSVYRGHASFGGTCEMYCANRYSMVAHFVAAASRKYARDIVRIACRGITRRVTGWIRIPASAGRPAPSASGTTQAQS